MTEEFQATKRIEQKETETAVDAFSIFKEAKWIYLFRWSPAVWTEKNWMNKIVVMNSQEWSPDDDPIKPIHNTVIRQKGW